MPLPVFVGAGSLMAVTTGTATVSKTGCTAGNFLMLDIVERGLSGDFSGPSSVTNVNRIDGSTGFFSGNAPTSNAGIGATSQRFLYAGRVAANGTCSGDLTVGASGNDLFAVIYEFSGVSPGTWNGALFENVGGSSDQFLSTSGTSTTVADAITVTRLSNRLALQFVALDANNAIGSFTGETGGDWTSASELGSSTGATARIQLQTAAMPRAGTIDGGTATITSSGWGVVGLALIPSDDNDLASIAWTTV